jgi:hypothetical protein
LPSITSTNASQISSPHSSTSREQAIAQPWPLRRLLEVGLRC